MLKKNNKTSKTQSLFIEPTESMESVWMSLSSVFRHTVNAVSLSANLPSASGECDISNCHLADLDGEVLNLYGSGAIPALDKNWGVQAASHVTTISFKFIDFDHISPHFAKIRARFPNANTLIFDETNIRFMHQLNALAQLRKLEHLVIKSSGNPMVNNMQLWKYYALHRLSQFNIRRINDSPVSCLDPGRNKAPFFNFPDLI